VDKKFSEFTAKPTPVSGDQVVGISGADNIRIPVDAFATGAEGDKANTAVQTVAGTAPITSTGTTAKTIGITAATTSAPGSMSAADKTKLDAITGTNTGNNTGDVTVTDTTTVDLTITGQALTAAVVANSIGSAQLDAATDSAIALANTSVQTVTGTAPISATGTTAKTIAISAATTGAAGSMSASDKTKLDAITGTNTGDVTVTDTATIDLTVTGQALTAAVVANSIGAAQLAPAVDASLALADSAVQSFSNLGAGVGITGTKTAAEDLTFKSLVQGANVTITSDANTVTIAASGSGGGHVIQDEGTPLTTRANLNFAGTGVAVTDGGAGPNSTIVTIEEPVVASQANYLWNATALGAAPPGVSPGAGYIGANNNNVATTTFLYISSTDADGNDRSPGLSIMAAGDILIVQDKATNNKTYRFRTSGVATDQTGYWTVPCTVESSGAGGESLSGAPVLVIAMFAGGSSTGGVSDGNKGDITVGAGGTDWQINALAVGTTELAASAVTGPKIAGASVDNTKMTNIAQATVKGRQVAAGTGQVQDLTGPQVGAMINLPELNDVTVTLPADNDVLTYDTGTSQWINQAPAGSPTTIVGITGTKAQFDTAVTDGDFVYQNSPLGTPTSGTLTNATGLPIIAGTTGTLSVARGGTGVTTSTGTGSTVLSASPVFTGNPTAPTPATADNDTSVATTAHVQANALLKENALGNPSTNGYVLSSTTAGSRSWIAPVSGSGGHAIQEEGTPLTARANLNFVGGGVQATDGGATPDSTIVTIPAQGGNVRYVFNSNISPVPPVTNFSANQANPSAITVFYLNTTSAGLVDVSSGLENYRSGGSFYYQSSMDTNFIALYRIEIVTKVGSVYQIAVKYITSGPSLVMPPDQTLCLIGYVAPDVSLGQTKTLTVSTTPTGEYHFPTLEAALIYVNSRPLGTVSQTDTTQAAPPLYDIQINPAGLTLTGSYRLDNITAPIFISCTAGIAGTPVLASGAILTISGCSSVTFQQCAVAGRVNVYDSNVDFGNSIGSDIANSVNLTSATVVAYRRSSLAWYYSSNATYAKVENFTVNNGSYLRIQNIAAGPTVFEATRIVASENSRIYIPSSITFTSSSVQIRLEAINAGVISVFGTITLAAGITTTIPVTATLGGIINLSSAPINTAGYTNVYNIPPGEVNTDGASIFVTGTLTSVEASPKNLTQDLDCSFGGVNYDINNLSQLRMTYGSGVIPAVGDAYIDIAGSYTWSGSGLVLPYALNYSGTQTLNGNGGVLGTGFLFNNTATITNGGVTRTMGPFYTLNSAPFFKATGTGVSLSLSAPASFFPTTDIRVNPNFVTENTATLTVNNHCSILLAGTPTSIAGAPLNITCRKGIQIDSLGANGSGVSPAGTTITSQVGISIAPMNAVSFSAQILLNVPPATLVTPTGITGTWALWQEKTTNAGYWNLEAPVITGYRQSAVSITGLRTDASVVMTGASTVYTLPTLAVLTAAASAGTGVYTAASLNGLMITVHCSQATSTVAAGAGIAFATGTTGTFTAGQKKQYIFDGVSLWY
jgi:hypothetical protein